MSNLIAMRRGSEVLPVHESCVEAHRKIGFVEAPDADVEALVAEQVSGDETASADSADGVIDIPDDWATLHHAKRAAIASKIKREKVAAADANAVIEAFIASKASDAA